MTDKHRPEMIPKPYRNKGMPDTLSQYCPAFSRGLQGQKMPENDTGIYRFAADTATPGETAERSVTHATHEQEAAAGMVFFLNHRNRITYNDLCRGCTHDCKQSFRAIVVLCPGTIPTLETAGNGGNQHR